MIKKQLADGSPCKKCQQAEDLLKRRGLWERIDEVVWAYENDPDSPGMQLAAKHDVALAPFFIVRNGDEIVVYTSSLELIKQRLAPTLAAPSERPALAARPLDEVGLSEISSGLGGAEPQAVLERVLGVYGDAAVIAFSGAEDVVLIDMAAKSGKKFSVLTLDTGRLHPETYRFLDKVRAHYGIEIRLLFPDMVKVEDMVRRKGLYSFYNEGHRECCGIRKLEPLARGLRNFRAWISGQRRDQSPTRGDVNVFELDDVHAGPEGPLLKLNPLANWSLADTWSYIRDNAVPYNELHDQGFISIGCEPCTRAIRPGEHERAGRWWWEESTKRECGLHR
ncbi:MAG TPA: phosphoadenylyl-sulfate reductase [Polyangiaceae bacterium]|nr:phosphoadenylyl-sulfate reductase [Polyangiaceae bacterium]